MKGSPAEPGSLSHRGRLGLGVSGAVTGPEQSLLCLFYNHSGISSALPENLWFPQRPTPSKVIYKFTLDVTCTSILFFLPSLCFLDNSL